MRIRGPQFMAAACGLVLAIAGLVACSSPAPNKTNTAGGGQQPNYEQYVDDQRDALQSMHPDVEIPDTELIRYVSLYEWAPAIVDCMLEQGFGASLLSDGGVSYEEPPAGQEEGLAVAAYVCAVEYPVELTEQLNDVQLRKLYNYYVNDLVPCLADEGYDINDIPSFETFRDRYGSSPWSPYSSVSPSTQLGWDAINAACPQNPDGL